MLIIEHHGQCLAQYAWHFTLCLQVSPSQLFLLAKHLVQAVRCAHVKVLNEEIAVLRILVASSRLPDPW